MAGLFHLVILCVRPIVSSLLGRGFYGRELDAIGSCSKQLVGPVLGIMFFQILDHVFLNEC